MNNTDKKPLKATHFRWVIVCVLFIVTITNYINRAAFPYVIDTISSVYHFDSEQIGLILGIFGIGYAISTFFGGLSADRVGARKTLFFAIIFWSLSVMLMGLTTGFLVALLARLLLGLAEGPNFPCMTRSIGDWLPLKQRATALSYSLIAVPLALAISGPIVSQLIVHTSWRATFFILGILGMMLAPIWWYIFRDSPGQSKYVNTTEQALIERQSDANQVLSSVVPTHNNGQSIWRFLLTNPTLLANYWAYFVFGYYLFFFIGWLPAFFEREYGLNLSQTGYMTVLPWLLSAVLMWVMGYVSDYILKRTKSYRLSRSYPILISQLLAAVCIMPVIYVHNIHWVGFFISLAVACNMSTNAMFYAINIDVIKKHAATALGIMHACSAIAGFLAPTITGVIVYVTGHFASAFGLLAVLALSSVVVMALFHRPDSICN